MNKIMKAVSFALLLGHLLSGAAAKAQTINAASCNQSDVQAALNSVTATTTIVNIPAGTCSWGNGSAVTFTVPTGSTSLSILGAGSLSTTGGGDVTVIVDNDTTDLDHLIKITTAAASSYFRLAGITIAGGSGVGKQNGVLNFGGFSQNLRVDHSHLNGAGYTSPSTYADVRISGWQYGVMDHCIIDGSSAIEIWDDLYNNDASGAGNASWAAASNFGSGQAFFIENNTYNYSGFGSTSAGTATDCMAGGRMVVRYNTINNVAVYVHPTGGSGQYRGCRTEEVYNNTFIGSNSTPTFTAFWTSSGTALVWGNSAPTGFESLIDLHSMRRNNTTYNQTAPPNGWGYCGTSFNGTGSAWDGNTIVSTGYPCLDQPGQGVGQLLSSQWFPNALNTVTGTISWPHEKLEPIYEWLDTWNPVPNYAKSEISNSDASAFTANADYYQYTSTFTGASGTGSGSLSARPSTCTPMVAYWATDTNTLYQCSAANTWTTYYTPYTYPHPLVGQASPPAPPGDVKAVAH